ncbi:MAG: TIM barrel protein, partial [Candidatus Baldrarchaeia archaeon]
ALASEFTRLPAPPPLKRLINEAFSDFASESVKSLIELSKIDSRRIAVENVEFDFEYTRRIVDANDTSICFDTGHLMAGYSGDYDPLQFLEKNFDRIVELHLHDGYRRVVNGRVEIGDHLALGDGDLPVCSLLNLLQERGFDGVIVFELPLESALKSMEYIRLNCKNLDL